MITLAMFKLIYALSVTSAPSNRLNESRSKMIQSVCSSFVYLYSSLLNWYWLNIKKVSLVQNIPIIIRFFIVIPKEMCFLPIPRQTLSLQIPAELKLLLFFSTLI